MIRIPLQHKAVPLVAISILTGTTALFADWANFGPMAISGPFFMGAGSNFTNSETKAHVMFQNPNSGNGSYSVTSWQNLNGAVITFQATSTPITLSITGTNDSVFDGFINTDPDATGGRIIKQNTASTITFKSTLDSSNWNGVFELAAGLAVIENTLHATVEISGSNTRLDISNTTLLSALTVNTDISTSLNIGSKLNSNALHLDNITINDNASIVFDIDLSLFDINPGDLLVFLSADSSIFGENLFFGDTNLNYNGSQLIGQWLTENNQIAFKVSEIPEIPSYAIFFSFSILTYAVISKRKRR